MATNYIYKLDNNKIAETFYSKNANRLSNSGLYIITKSNTNIYSSSSKALSDANSISSNSDKAMMMIKGKTSAKVHDVVKDHNRILVKIYAGTKEAWLYVGTVQAYGSSTGHYYRWTVGPTVNIGATKDCLKKFNIRRYKASNSPVKYSNLNLSTSEVDADRLANTNQNEIDNANNNTAEKRTNTTDNITSGNSTTGESNVTYEFAVKAAPNTYYYDIGKYIRDNSYEAYASQNTINSGIDYSKLKYIFGIPYQYLPTTDCRVGDDFSDEIEQAGYEFADKIISRMPLLYVTPGNTAFMGNAGSKENYRTFLLGKLGVSGATSGENDIMESSLETMLGEYNGKLYTLTPAYKEYFEYVNPLCRAGAIFLDIGDMSFESESGGSNKFQNYNWGINQGIAYEIYTEEESTEDDTEESDISEEDNTDDANGTKAKFEEDYSDFFKSTIEKISEKISDFESRLYYGNSIAFYINSDASFQDSFGNETTESSLSSLINGLSDKAREIQFLLGTSRQMVGEAFDKVDGTLGPIKQQIDNIVNKIAGGNSIFTTIAKSVKTIVSGGRLQFPQIWSNSSFSKSYSISIKLNTPSTDRVSWWLNIYVPLCHLMGLILPRSEYINSYTTPFIVKAFYKGMFNIDMGIITEMTFTKGKEGSWTKDGLPTVVDVSFTIQDLYSTMSMTSTESMFKGKTLQNVAEMDYIANLCGININEPDTFRMIRLWCAFNISNRVYDFIPNLEMGVEKYIGNRVLNAYNNFWF